MARFLKFTMPNGAEVHIDPKQVVRVSPRLSGQDGCTLNFTSGQSQDVSEPMDEVLADLEGVD
jgi:hypothetical protein